MSFLLYKVNDAYREYCRCWQVYLDRIGRNADFTMRMTTRLPADVTVFRWPLIWIEVDWLFETRGQPGSGRDNFVAAVRYAERRP